MPTDRYGEELSEIIDCLGKAGFNPLIRGDGAARFVFVEHKQRAAEICRDNQAWSIEVFEEPQEFAIRQTNQSKMDQAIGEVAAWLRTQ
jgi:hypothetical protein